MLCLFSNLVLLQWGIANSTSGTGQVTLSLSYSNTYYCVAYATVETGSSTQVRSFDRTNSTFKVQTWTGYAGGSSTSMGFRWMTIGY